jgi:hypothetical protein
MVDHQGRGWRRAAAAAAAAAAFLRSYLIAWLHGYMTHACRHCPGPALPWASTASSTRAHAACLPADSAMLFIGLTSAA